MRRRTNLPPGLWYGKAPKPKTDIVGVRIGDVTVARLAAAPYAIVRCDRGHETYRTRSYLRQVMQGKDTSRVHCDECRRVEQEEKQAYRMGWPLVPEGAE